MTYDYDDDDDDDDHDYDIILYYYPSQFYVLLTCRPVKLRATTESGSGPDRA